MRRIPYTNIEIYKDDRIPIVRKILSSLISKLEMQDSIVTIMPDNTMIAICRLTTVFTCTLKECTPGFTIYIDPRTFYDEFIESYKILEDEFIAFKQDSSTLYLNIANTNQLYFYNIDKYKLIDKIEDITSFEDFNYYLSLKSEDGSKFFKGYNNNFILPIYTKFPNISKSDVANLYVYDFDQESNLVVWKVYKKKLSRDVYTVFRVLKLF